MAWDHALSRAVLGVYARVLLDVYARGAREHGIRDGRTGTVTVIQRSASGLNLNVHFHTLALDGVFSEGHAGALEFHPAPAPRDDEVAEVLATVRHRVQRQLARRGLEPGDEATAPTDRLAEESPLLAGIVSASVQGRWRWALMPGLRYADSGGSRMSRPRRLEVPVKRTWRASICTLMCGCRPTIGPGWSACAGMCCARPSPKSACGCGATVASR